jgi:hypothetical protein
MSAALRTTPTTPGQPPPPSAPWSGSVWWYVGAKVPATPMVTLLALTRHLVNCMCAQDADALTRGMTQEEYLQYAECRQASFIGRNTKVAHGVEHRERDRERHRSPRTQASMDIGAHGPWWYAVLRDSVVRGTAVS